MELNQRIAMARKQAGLSQEQLGEKLGVSRQAVSKWESGQTNPDVAYVAEMCRLFGVSSDWLLLGQETDQAKTPVRCSSCQAIITGLDNFCPNCGHSLRASGCETYSLVLLSNNIFSSHLALEQIAKLSWCSPEFPIYHLSSPQVEDLVRKAPITLMWGLSPERTAQALEYFSDSDAVAVYRDSDGNQAEQLISTPEVPKQSLPTPPKEPISFGATVGAVILGFIAAILILSIL
ncbi:MAG: helix-turn-helix domain-containing protein [Lawsonibacter sp.]|jgi:DNA-binding XRE family transcriptional regulator